MRDTIRHLRAILTASGIDPQGLHSEHARALATMTDAQRETVAVLVAAAYENGQTVMGA